VGSLTKDKVAARKGQPGFKLVCLVAGLKVSDECKTTEGHEARVELKDSTEEEVPVNVLALYSATLEKESEAATCSVGGAESGLVVGELAIFGPVQVGEEQPARNPIRLIRGNQSLRAVAGRSVTEVYEYENEVEVNYERAEVINFPTDARVWTEVAGTNRCTGRIAANGRCTIEVRFAPPARISYPALIYFKYKNERNPGSILTYSLTPLGGLGT
jgi:hypothetical protein